MTLAVCLDDNGGMMYNNRRQSRDRVLIADLTEAAFLGIVTAPYSASLFSEGTHLRISEHPMEDAAADETAFIEDPRLIPTLDGVKRLIIYRWCKLYPTDLRFPYDPAELGYRLTEEKEFVGSSHDKIWKGIYEK